MKRNIDGRTELICLLGSPVAHSLSPKMHNEAFALLGLNYVYTAFDVNPKTLEEAVNGLRVIGARGWNCTMPNKNKMCELVDIRSFAAELTGAVNTVVNENGVLTGHITDGTGFMWALGDQNISVLGKKMTVLGVGGAATAIYVQAALDGVGEVSIFNRKGESFEGAKKLVRRLNEETLCKVNLYDLADEARLRKEIKESRVLVNGTSVGMAPNIENSVIEDASMLYQGLVVCDIIYNPMETKLLAMAKSRGCKTLNGLSMLLFQGAKAFSLWTGMEMPVEAIKPLILESLTP